MSYSSDEILKMFADSFYHYRSEPRVIEDIDIDIDIDICPDCDEYYENCTCEEDESHESA